MVGFNNQGGVVMSKKSNVVSFTGQYKGPSNGASLPLGQKPSEITSLDERRSWRRKFKANFFQIWFWQPQYSQGRSKFGPLIILLQPVLVSGFCVTAWQWGWPSPGWLVAISFFPVVAIATSFWLLSRQGIELRSDQEK